MRLRGENQGFQSLHIRFEISVNYSSRSGWYLEWMGGAGVKKGARVLPAGRHPHQGSAEPSQETPAEESEQGLSGR